MVRFLELFSWRQMDLVLLYMPAIRLPRLFFPRIIPTVIFDFLNGLCHALIRATLPNTRSCCFRVLVGWKGCVFVCLFVMKCFVFNGWLVRILFRGLRSGEYHFCRFVGMCFGSLPLRMVSWAASLLHCLNTIISIFWQHPLHVPQ